MRSEYNLTTMAAAYYYVLSSFSTLSSACTCDIPSFSARSYQDPSHACVVFAQRMGEVGDLLLNSKKSFGGLPSKSGGVLPFLRFRIEKQRWSDVRFAK
jgi:hypothetical protein